MSTNQDQLDVTRHALDERDPERDWLRTLEVLLHTGVADSLQLQKATDINRHRLRRVIERMDQAAVGIQPVLITVEEKIPRPGIRGRGPNVYRLGVTGAALARDAGHEDARPCKLTKPTPIAHALATLEVRLAAVAAGLDVQTERELPYGDGRVLRPDNLVTLADGTVALFETEQLARPALLRRIIEGLQNKVAFFESPEGKAVSSTVRVIFYLARGKDWERTINVWERGLATVAQERGGSLPFRLLAIPLIEFMEQPDWEEPPASNRWENLFDPALLKGFDATADSGKGTKQLPVQRKASLPQGLARRSSRDDQLILAALWQTFHEEVAASERERFAAADPSFFDVMGLIHAANHDPEAPVLVQAGVPYASLYLLAQYLRMHPYLRQAVSRAVGRSRGSMRWNATNVLHRMQVVIDTFLKYHGWRSDGPLLAYPMTSDWNSEGSRTFGVTVRIRNPEVLMEPGDGVVPGRDEIQQAEEALAWVLWAMFAHASELGLKTPPFW